MSRIRSAVSAALSAVAVAALALTGALVPAASASAAPAALSVPSWTTGWQPEILDFGWRFEVYNVVNGATVTLTDAANVTYTFPGATPIGGVLPVIVPSTITLPISFQQNDGVESSPAVTPPIVLLPRTPSNVTPPWINGSSYLVEIAGVPGGHTITVTDANAATVSQTNSGTGTSTLTLSLPPGTVEPVSVRTSFGGALSTVSTFPLTWAVTPTVTSLTGPDGSGRWPVQGTGTPGDVVTIRNAAGSTVTFPNSATVAANGTWSLAINSSAVVPLIVVQLHSADQPRRFSAPATIATLPGGASMTVTPAVSTAGLSSPPRAGDVLTYSFTVANTGTSSLSSVAINPTLSGISALSYAWPGTAGTLAVGQSVTATATYALTQADVDAGVVAGSVSASSTQATASSQSFSTTLARVPALTTVASVSTSGLSSPPQAGDPLTYTVTMTNTGNVTLTSVAAAATPAGIGPFSYTWPGSPGVLAPGQSVTGTATYTITGADVGSGSITATITGSGQPPAGGPVSSAASTVTTDLAIDPPAITSVTGPDATGWDVVGTGEPGATVTITPATGAPITALVQPDGSWTAAVPLTATGPISAIQTLGPLVSTPVTAPLPGLAAPSIDPIGTPDASGWDVTGTGVPGATVTLTPATGSPVTATVQPDGTWSAALPLSATGPVTARQAFGPVQSGPASAPLPPPAATPVPVVVSVTGPDATGWDIIGTGEPGATITITDQDGTDVTATVQPDGTWSAALPLTTAGPVDVTQTIGASTSDPVPATLPSLNPPTINPVATPGSSGWPVSGTGVPGATVTVTPATGSPVTATVQPDGTWSATVPSSATGPVSATQALGPVASSAVTAPLPPAPAPVTVTSVLGPDPSGQWLVTGTGETGATVTLTDDNGVDVIVPVIAGGWSAVLPAATEGPLAVRQTVGAVTSAPLIVPLPVSALTVTASADASGLAATPQPGDPVAFTFTLTNTGDTALTGVAATSSLSGLTITYAWPGAAGALAPGQSVTATASYPITQSDIDARLVASTVGASALNPAAGPVTATPATTSTPILAVSELTVTPSADVSALSTPPQVGELVTFTFDIDNTGSSTVTGVTLGSTLPGISSLTYVWPGTPGVLAPGERATATATYALVTADVQALEIVAPHTATATGQAPDTTPVTASVVVTTPLGAPPAPPVIDIAGPNSAGEYTIRGTGIGGATIVITDDGGRTTTTTVGGGGSWTATLPAVTTGPLSVIQRVGAVASPQTVVSSIPVTAATLQVTDDDSGVGAPPELGDEVDFTIVVTNTGTVPLTGVGVTTTVPGIPSVTFTGWPGAAGTLQPGESVTATVTRALTQADLDAGQVAGVASLIGTGPSGNAVVTPSVPVLVPIASIAEARMTVEARIEGELAPSAPGVSVTAGPDVEWAVTVTNNGPVTLNGVTGLTGDVQPAAAPLDGLDAISAAALVAPSGFTGTLAPGASVVFTGSGPALVGTHGLLATVSARVGTAQVAGQPVTLTGSGTMYYTATAVTAPGGGGSGGGGGGLAWTGLDISMYVAAGLALAGFGVSALILAAARRRSRP